MYNPLQIFYAKDGSKKQLLFEKWEHFENIQKWPPSKGYRPCNILTSNQKLKMHKNMLKIFLQNIAFALCKKRLQKAVNIRKMRAFWKLPKMATKQRLKTLQNRHFGSKMKNACYKRFYNTLQLIYAKKGSKKQLIFERWEDFENSQKWPPSKGYRLCKVVSLGQKLKMPKKTYYKYFYNTLHLFYVRNGSKKRLISEKWDHFENSQGEIRSFRVRLYSGFLTET